MPHPFCFEPGTLHYVAKSEFRSARGKVAEVIQMQTAGEGRMHE
jgi:hypothetical protein